MIRLLRSGTPAEILAKKYDALADYIYMLNDRFSKDGVIGILTEEDFEKFRLVNPEVIRICTFNLHGTHNNDESRYKRIAHELSLLIPDLCAFQEVIRGDGMDDTSRRIARRLSHITGSHYRTHFAHCHLFMEKYPEGVSVSSRCQLRNKHIIDLNQGLRKGLRPVMERFAAATEVMIYGRRVVFASVHLDHTDNPEVRLAQAEKLLEELGHLFKKGDYHCFILAGDFNDVEGSPVMSFLRRNGFKDAFLECRQNGENTYSTVNPHMRIDYILVRGDVGFLSAELILNDPDLSDHIGVYAVIK